MASAGRTARGASASDAASSQRSATAGAPRADLAAAAKRAFANFRAHEMTDKAAALTYYAMLSLFPLLIVAVSLFGLIGDPRTVTDFVDYLARNGADPNTRATIDDAMRKIVDSSGGAKGAALVVSTLIALNGASGAFGAAGRALNQIHAVDEDRGFVRRKLTDLGMTLVIVVLLLVVIGSLFIGGGIAEDVFGLIGLGSTAADVWLVARWPVALGAAMMAFALIYAFSPDVSPRTIRWLSPGAVAGVLVWIVASVGFAIYVQNFSSYGAAYGAAGAVLVLLLWLWISSCAFLFGGELNVEIERAESAGRGGPPPPTPPPAAPAAAERHPTSTGPVARGT